MSEFDKYAFEEPANIEDNPRAIEELTSLVEAVFPVRIEELPEDVSDLSLTRIVDDGITVRISAYQQKIDDEGVVGYSIEVEEEYYWPNDSDFTLQYERRCEISLIPSSLELGLVCDLKSEYDPTGDLIGTAGHDAEHLDTHTLLYVVAKLESLPGSMKYLIDSSQTKALE